MTSILLPLLLALIISGWYYGRVWAYFGTPIVGNWNASSGFALVAGPRVSHLRFFMPASAALFFCRAHLRQL